MGFSTIGVAVAGAFSIGGVVAGSFAAIAIGVVTSAVVGAAIGGIAAAVTGGDIGKGMLFGAIGGVVVGGLAGGAIVNGLGAGIGESAAYTGVIEGGSGAGGLGAGAFATPTVEGATYAAGVEGGFAGGAVKAGGASKLFGGAVDLGESTLMSKGVDFALGGLKETPGLSFDEQMQMQRERLASAEKTAAMRSGGSGAARPQENWQITKEGTMYSAGEQYSLQQLSGKQGQEAQAQEYALARENEAEKYKRETDKYRGAAAALSGISYQAPPEQVA